MHLSLPYLFLRLGWHPTFICFGSDFWGRSCTDHCRTTCPPSVFHAPRLCGSLRNPWETCPPRYVWFFFCVVCLWQELRRSCNLCFALTGYPVNLKMETVTNGKKLQNIMWGKRPKSNVTSNANYWETKLAGVSPIVLWVLEGDISHSFRRWGSLCNLICLSFFGLVKDALICCKICSSPSLEGRKEREWLLCIILGARHCTLDRQEGRDWQKPSFSSKNTLDYRVQTSWAPCYPNVQGRLERGWKNSYLRGGICPHVVRNFCVWVTSLQNCPLSFYNRFGNFIHTYFCATRASL